LLQAMQVRGLSFACDQLVSLANARGGHDNITVMIAQLGGSAPEPLRQTIPETVSAAALPAPAATVPEMPTLADEPGSPLAPGLPLAPVAASGPVPTVIDEQYASDPVVALPAATAPVSSASKPTGIMIAGFALVVGGLALVAMSFFWAVSRAAPSDPTDLEQPTSRPATSASASSVDPLVDSKTRPRPDASSPSAPPSSVPRTARSAGR
jgi:PPM family protein phosphatase